MNGGGGGAPPSNGGEYLLHLLRNNNTTSHQSHTPQQTFPHDPAIAAVGPSIRPTYLPPNIDFGYGNWHPSSSPPIAPNNGGYFQQNPSSNPHLNPNFGAQQFDRQPVRSSKFATSEQDLVFGSVNRDLVKNSGLNGIQVDLATLAGRGSGSGSERGREVQNGNYRMGQTPPPGFSSRVSSSSGVGNERVVERSVDKGKSNLVDRQSNKMSGNAGNGRVVERNVNKGKANFVDHQRYRADSSIGVMTQNNLHSVPVCEVKESVHVVRVGDDENARDLRDGDLEDSLEQAVESLVLDDESGDKNDKKKHHRDKDYRSDKRGQWIMGQRMRNQKSYTSCRNDINRLSSPFLALFESLIPAEEEKIKQEQLLTVLKKLVSNEWPEARLYLYGSCGNSFCFSKSDIDICLAMELGSVEKSEVLLKLAEIFMSDNLQNVQALTRARVPIVKLMDPVTGICCDICINNLLAVVNTKLLRDYSKIDVRLRQLVFLVKHWAKSRGVNETYHGTLSSYAYVLMCIHFLQQRRPAILPCLQAMEFTYHATVDNVEYGFFDKVEKLCNFGSQNRESIAQLVWGFFHYWAYCHDYANDVISVRTGHTISKRAKDWTRRVGNDRHLICIEDPFELSHDLGRVVDKFSIRVLREEFERAAHIMQYDPNPCVTLFEPYIPE